MARPKKQGLDYFPLDTQFLSDVKVRKIMRAQGTNAISVLISLLCNIYRDEGYYIRRDSDVGFLISDEIGVKEEYVNEVIDKAISVGFFDKNQYEKNNILTSNGIQKRFLEATERRKEIVFDENYAVNVNINSINERKNRVNEYKSTQSKVKESKVKESKVNEKEKFPPSTTKEILSSRKIVIEQWAMNYHVSVERIQECIIEFAEFKYRSKENLKWQNESDLIKNFEFWLNSNAKPKLKPNTQNGTTNREIYRNG